MVLKFAVRVGWVVVFRVVSVVFGSCRYSCIWVVRGRLKLDFFLEEIRIIFSLILILIIEKLGRYSLCVERLLYVC